MFGEWQWVVVGEKFAVVLVELVDSNILGTAEAERSYLRINRRSAAENTEGRVRVLDDMASH
jgi:hypothetical protein